MVLFTCRERILSASNVTIGSSDIRVVSLPAAHNAENSLLLDGWKKHGVLLSYNEGEIIFYFIFYFLISWTRKLRVIVRKGVVKFLKQGQLHSG